MKGPRAGTRCARSGESQVLRGVLGRAAGGVRAARREGPLPARSQRRAARLHWRGRRVRAAEEGGPRAAHGAPLARRLPQTPHRHAPGARMLAFLMPSTYANHIVYSS